MMRTKRWLTVASSSLALALAGACGSSPSAAHSSEALLGEYRATAPGAIREVVFSDATRYSMIRATCVPSQGTCVERGTYALGDDGDSVAFTDETTSKTTRLPLRITKSAAARASVRAAKRRRAPLDLAAEGGAVSLLEGEGGTGVALSGDGGVALTQDGGVSVCVTGSGDPLVVGDDVQLVSSFALDGQAFSGGTTECGAEGSATPRDQMGVNVNSLVDPSFVGPTLAIAKQLGVGWIRLEIDRAQPPEYWTGVVQQFHDANIQVLAALTNDSWTGGAIDGDLQNRDPSSLDPLTDPGCTSAPGSWGSGTLVPQFIAEVDPYVQAIRSNVQSWEIWNEANNGVTALCPANYAQLLAQARTTWGDIGVRGPSLLSIGSSGNTQNNSVAYMQALYDADPSVAQRSGGGSSWDRVMLHPYPDEGGGDQDPTEYLGDVAGAFAFQGAPLWFTEIGYQSDDHDANACHLGQAYGAASSLADRTFWFALYNCVPNYGLLDACTTGASPRPEFSALVAQGMTGPEDMSSDPQNCGGCGHVCGAGQVCQASECVQP